MLWNEDAPRAKVSDSPLGFERFKLSTGGSDGGDEWPRRLDMLRGISGGGEDSLLASLTCSIESRRLGVTVAALLRGWSSSMWTGTMPGEFGDRMGTVRRRGGGLLRTVTDGCPCSFPPTCERPALRGRFGERSGSSDGDAIVTSRTGHCRFEEIVERGAVGDGEALGRGYRNTPAGEKGTPRARGARGECGERSGDRGAMSRGE